MTFRFIALAASALTCLSTAAHAEVREPVTARVSYAGLDLASVAGRRILDARIEAAARRACVSKAWGFRGHIDAARCRNEMRRDAQVRVAALVGRVEVASAR